MNVKALPESYDQLRESFTGAMRIIGKILKPDERVGRLGIWENKTNLVFAGFGHEIKFSWRFVVHHDAGFGCFSVSRGTGTNPFYEIFFRGTVPVFLKSLEQQTPDFYGNQILDMEVLLTEIIGKFLEQDCFKP